MTDNENEERTIAEVIVSGNLNPAEQLTSALEQLVPELIKATGAIDGKAVMAALVSVTMAYLAICAKDGREAVALEHLIVDMRKALPLVIENQRRKGGRKIGEERLGIIVPGNDSLN